MNLRVQTSNPFPTPPSYLQDVVNFVISNIANPTLFEFFCFILKHSTSITKFIEYKQKFVPPSPLESNLLNLMEVFFSSSGSDLDNKRGELLEIIVIELVKTSKYSTYTQSNQAILELIDSSGNIVYTLSPNNIDFFLENPNLIHSLCLECKISVEQNSTQIACFNTLAGYLKSNGLNTPVNVVHPITDTGFAKLYPRWYPDLNFIGPEDIQKGNF